MSKIVLLLRHGEEPKEQSSLDLSEIGRTRARKLAAFIPKQFGAPDFIFAASPTGASVRSYLTMRQLADTIKSRIDGSYKARDFAQLASKVLADPAFDDKVIVICWTHSELPALASALNNVNLRVKLMPTPAGRDFSDRRSSACPPRDRRALRPGRSGCTRNCAGTRKRP